MAFSVTKAKWLETESKRLADIVLMPRFWHRAWTDHSLKDALSEIGLDYSLTDIRALNDELHKQGVVEDVKETIPAPEPVFIQPI